MRLGALASIILILAATPALSGCVEVAPSGQDVTPDAVDGASESVLPDLSDVPEPATDPERTRVWWEDFVKAYPKRDSGSPTNAMAAEQLVSDLEAAGFKAKTLYYLTTPRVDAPCAQSPTEEGMRVIVGVKEGTEMPDHVIGWVSHYDANVKTIEAAYDDGSGTAVGIELARAFSDVDTRKTLMAIFFDAEEMGLVTSRCFVEDAVGRDGAVFDLIIGHDMVGINWPGHEWPMYQMLGENYVGELRPVMEALYREHLGLPEDGVVILDVHDRNSDERRFKEAGVPIIRMAGGRNASDYPAYHQPNDTVEYLYDFVGGPENFEKGLRTVLETTWWSVHTFDRLPSVTKALV